VTSGAFLYAVIWWPTLQWHATKWRLAAACCSPWRLATAVKASGVFELVQLIVHYVPAPEGPPERYPTLVQGEDCLWRDESGRRVGIE
jgi:hypothetical protein